MLEGLRYLVKNYIFLSLVVASLTYFTYLSTASIPNVGYILFTGIATYILYNYHTHFRFDSNHIKIKWQNNSHKLLLISIFFIVGFILFSMTIIESAVLALASLLALGYFIPFTAQKKSLRDYFWIKPLTIGTVFAIITATLPYHNGGYSWFESSLLSLGRLFFVASLAIIFDIGDVAEDHLQKVKTIPQTYGVTTAKIMSSIFLLLSALIEGYGAWTFLIEIHGIVSLSITYFVVWVLLLMATEKRAWWYYLVLVDGVMGLPLVIFWVL